MLSLEGVVMLFSYITSFIVYATGHLTITHRIHAQQTVPLKHIQHRVQLLDSLVQYQIITVRRVLYQFLVQLFYSNCDVSDRISHGLQGAF